MGDGRGHKWVDAADGLPPIAGAYILLIQLKQPAPLPPRWPGKRLSAGRYVYFGSANGPGGIRARCARHFRIHKKQHWHVDWLTVAADDLRATAFPKRSECDLTERALGFSGVSVPVDGFGSSDCRTCDAHLLALSPEISDKRFLNSILD
ncbi:MAG: GIY-YIG nuclease family protein [Rhodospirillales bacterium]|nr:GIY-YIG nuclease family protein [Rhodospirillales bacterium]